MKSFDNKPSHLDYDRSNQTLYVILDEREQVETGSFLSKRKTSENNAYNNLFSQEMAQKKARPLLSEEIALSHNILSFYFEQYYDEEEKRLVFNRPLPSLNNWRLEERPLSNVLLLETLHREEQEKYLWFVHRDSKLVGTPYHLPKGSEWHLDVANEKLYIIDYKERQVSIRTHKWDAQE